MWLPNCYHGTYIFDMLANIPPIFFFYQCVMYFQSTSHGGSKYFHSETFKVDISSLSLCVCVIPVCICLYVWLSLALAKRTKASTRPCVWTKSSTSPPTWTLQWSVNSNRNRSILETVFDLFLYPLLEVETWFLAFCFACQKVGIDYLSMFKTHEWLRLDVVLQLITNKCCY